MQELRTETQLTLAGTYRPGTVPRSPQTQLHLKPSKSVVFSCIVMSCCEQDGDCPISSLLGLAPDALFALSCVAALYKTPLFPKAHAFCPFPALYFVNGCWKETLSNVAQMAACQPFILILHCHSPQQLCLPRAVRGLQQGWRAWQSCFSLEEQTLANFFFLFVRIIGIFFKVHTSRCFFLFLLLCY